jgi:hypothetical protein
LRKQDVSFAGYCKVPQFVVALQIAEFPAKLGAAIMEYYQAAYEPNWDDVAFNWE